MNTFVVLEELEDLSGAKVTYYTVLFEGNAYNELEDFFIRHQQNEAIRDELTDLVGWIQKIGNRIGAHIRYFRHERNAYALPPNRELLEIDYTENLRLYCMRISESIVILFNGGIKTKIARTPDECPTVRKYFNEALALTEAIDEKIKEKEITLDFENRKLIFPPDFEFEL